MLLSCFITARAPISTSPSNLLLKTSRHPLIAPFSGLVADLVGKDVIPISDAVKRGDEVSQSCFAT